MICPIASLLPLLVAAVSAVPIGSGETSSTLEPRQAGAPRWAPAATAAIHPGVNTDTNGGSCTSNFVYYQGSDVFIGQAAHCSGTGGSTSTDGCTSGSLPEGTQVTVVGASRPACAYNDLAIIKLDPADYGKVNPSIPVFGGPTGIRTTALGTAEPMYSYGNSILRQGVKVFSPKYGTHYSTDQNWSHNILLQFGIPGDSGSALFDGKGLASGVLSTLQFAPVPTSNGFGDFAREFAYLKSFPEFSGMNLALGTEPFAVRPPAVA